jgi:hypothetical protein
MYLKILFFFSSSGERPRDREAEERIGSPPSQAGSTQAKDLKIIFVSKHLNFEAF